MRNKGPSCVEMETLAGGSPRREGNKIEKAECIEGGEIGEISPGYVV